MRNTFADTQRLCGGERNRMRACRFKELRFRSWRNNVCPSDSPRVSAQNEEPARERWRERGRESEGEGRRGALISYCCQGEVVQASTLSSCRNVCGCDRIHAPPHTHTVCSLYDFSV
ncbi:unnamed protein product [Gadus morhua 'NCC']